jgi:hypothetical protein
MAEGLDGSDDGWGVLPQYDGADEQDAPGQEGAGEAAAEEAKEELAIIAQLEQRLGALASATGEAREAFLRSRRYRGVRAAVAALHKLLAAERMYGGQSPEGATHARHARGCYRATS